MTLRAAKAKRTKLTTAQELRSLRAWTQRLAKDVIHANEQLGIVTARLDAVLGSQRVLLQHLERVVREKDALVTSLRTGAPIELRGLPHDFEVQPIHRVAQR